MNNFESEKKNPPVEVIVDVLEQVSGGISDAEAILENEYGDPIEPGKEVMKPIPII